MLRKNKIKSGKYEVLPGFLHLPKRMLEMDDFKELSAKAIKLLVDMGSQYNGYNNGDLCCSMSLMRKRGWKSNDTLAKAKRELIERGWIKLTKKGGFNIGPDLFAITWQPIDECGGKLDVHATGRPIRSLKVA